MHKKLMRITLALATVLALTACSSKHQDPELNTNAQNHENASEQNDPSNKQNNPLTDQEDQAAKVIAEYNALLQSNGKLSEAISYLQEHIHEVAKEQATQMLLSLENAQIQAAPALEERYYAEDILQELADKGAYTRSIEDIISQLPDGKLKDLLSETQDNGYFLYSVEGMFFPVIDYETYTPYEDEINEDIAAYFKLKAKDTQAPALRDAAIAVSLEELLNRALDAEDFMTNYPSSPRSKEMKVLFQQYKGAIFFGSDNSQLFDYSTHIMNDEAQKTYNAYVGKTEASQSQLLRELKQYMDAAAKDGYKDSDTLKQMREKFLEIEPE
ncbi:hypothetical protein [Paenibacillus sp. GM2]|uniref:hypothetical protein n=1 Tax=Paenibacillus sp. GM2 TaxID=1622070 RepID=UPI000839BF9F|nr:hypothetical protein [Paenibacillus sp. GM2]